MTVTVTETQGHDFWTNLFVDGEYFGQIGVGDDNDDSIHFENVDDKEIAESYFGSHLSEYIDGEIEDENDEAFIGAFQDFIVSDDARAMWERTVVKGLIAEGIVKSKEEVIFA